MKLPISGVVITLNEAGNIQRCLESLDFCAELLVVDSGSNDETVAIARRLGARVIHQEWLGFGKQKQFSVDQAAHDWVLCLDADEWVSKPLAKSIESVFANTPDGKVYQFARKDYFLDRWLDHGSYPDMKIRLFHRGHAHWTEDMVHEKVVTSGAVSNCEGDLMHYTADSLSHSVMKRARYGEMQAQDLYERGKRPRGAKLFFSPLMRFLKLYVVQQGFRDGVAGFLMASISSFFCFYKYASLYELDIESRDK